MRKPIVRVTVLEKFRRMLECDTSYDTEQCFLETLKGEFTGNTLTRIGTAFHRIVETGEPQKTDGKDGCSIVVDGHVVRFDNIQQQIALDYREEHPGAYHEIRQSKDYGSLVVTGCSDMIDGVQIRDIKTKFSPPDDKGYIDSCQWKYYLDIFGADVFHFDLFHFEGYKEAVNKYDVRGLNLKRHTPPITCYRYSAMEQDLQYLANELMKYVKFRKLNNIMTYTT